MARRYTTAFDASEQLVGLLQADGLAGATTIVWGMPSEHEMTDEVVVVLGVRKPTGARQSPIEQETAAVGRTPGPRRQEEYVVEIVVDVAAHADAHADVNRRARDITHEIERVVDENPTLDGALPDDGWCHIGGAELDAQRNTETGAFRTIVGVDVFCTARI